jgi:hypothetical protein
MTEHTKDRLAGALRDFGLNAMTDMAAVRRPQMNAQHPSRVQTKERLSCTLSLLFLLLSQMSGGPQHLLLAGFPILCEQSHLLLEPVLVFPKHVGRRRRIAKALGRFKRCVHGHLTPGKPALRKFLEVVERYFLVFPELHAHRSIGLEGSRWLQDVRK